MGRGSRLTLGDTSLELSDTGGNDQDGTIGLGSTSDHVLDEISVTGGIDDTKALVSVDLDR
jgi:hypothetical protein